MTLDAETISAVEQAMSAMRAGKLVVIADDRDRENEGDLVLAAESATTEGINFMIQHGRGLICLSLEPERLQELQIPMQVAYNKSPLGTNFAVSFDHVSVGANGGSAEGRAKTIRASVEDGVRPSDFIMPGAVFPLRAVKGGVLRRRGQTEASVDLARLSGMKPAAVICECMDLDGSMLSGDRLLEYCKKFELPFVTVDQIARYRLERDVSVRRVGEMTFGAGAALLPREFGMLQEISAKTEIKILVFVDDADDREHLAFLIGPVRDGALARIHSECLTGDVFGSRRCDCGFQLQHAFHAMAQAGSGILVYLHQEGRGIGLANKLRAYELQDQGLDTVEANLALGFQADERNFRAAAEIFHDLGISKVRLLTNNREKIDALEHHGIKVAERLPSVAPADVLNAHYLETKRSRLGHLLPVPDPGTSV